MQQTKSDAATALTWVRPADQALRLLSACIKADRHVQHSEHDRCAARYEAD